jgi:hypothetical protein
VKAQYIGQSCERILSSGAARALIDYFVRVSLRVEFLLKEIRISLALLKAQPGGDAVAEADKNWPIGIWRTRGRERPGREQR